MAMIQKIRKHTWLLFGVIILALFAFLIMDATSGNMGGGAGQFTLAEVAGENIDYRQMQTAERVLYTNSDVDVFQRRNYIYNYFVGKKIIEKEAEKVGLGVGDDEMTELQFGSNLSPVIQQRFVDPNTGLVDRTQLNSIKQAIDAGQLPVDMVEYWSFQEEEIKKSQLETKLINMVNKGFYTPTWMAEEVNKDQNIRVDFLFVEIPFDDVPESEASVTDQEIRQYMVDHASQFEQDEESREVDFVAFDIVPTEADSSKLRERINDLIDQFKVTENDTIFVQSNQGTYDFAFEKPGALSPQIAEPVFDMEIDSIYGPYLESGAYKAVKLIDKKVIPDSVRSRHILRTANTQEQYNAAFLLIDSLKTMLEDPANTIPFDSLAMQYSQDPSNASSGGDLGFQAEFIFVKPFNDVVFYQAEPGELHTVITEYGVHLVEVLDRKYINKEEGVELAYIEVPIVPSEATQDSVYNEALNYVADNNTVSGLRDAIASSGALTIQSSTPFMKNDFSLPEIGTGQSARDIIRWSFEKDTEVDDLSPDIYTFQHPTLYFNQKYVIVGLRNIKEEGMSTIDDVRDEVTAILSSKKKGAYLANEIGTVDNLQAFAAERGLEIDTARGVNFLTDFISGLGEEPNVAVEVVATEEGQVSNPIIGSRAVYVVQPISKSTPDSTSGLASIRSNTNSRMINQSRAGILGSLRDVYKIKDNRSRFY